MNDFDIPWKRARREKFAREGLVTVVGGDQDCRYRFTPRPENVLPFPAPLVPVVAPEEEDIERSLPW